MVSSMNTEQTDDSQIPDSSEGVLRSSISKSLRSDRFGETNCFFKYEINIKLSLYSTEL